MTSAPAPERRNLGALLTDQIAALIREAPMELGAHLRTTELAKRFAVSRWPVEQALKALVEAGYVAHTPNRGYFVAALPPAHALPSVSQNDPVQRAYFELAAQLVAGELGAQISDHELRTRFNLSPRQGADLMARLVREGIAEKRSGYGWSLDTQLATPEALAQTYELRLILEPAALRLKGYSLAPEVIAQLRQTEEELRAGAIEWLTPDMLYQKAMNFHKTVVSGCGNPFLVQALVRVHRVRRLLTYRSMADRRRYYDQAAQHLEILDHIEAGRQEEAALAMEAHLSGVRSSMQRLGLLPDSEAETSASPELQAALAAMK